MSKVRFLGYSEQVIMPMQSQQGTLVFYVNGIKVSLSSFVLVKISISYNQDKLLSDTD